MRRGDSDEKLYRTHQRLIERAGKGKRERGKLLITLGKTTRSTVKGVRRMFSRA